MNDSPLSPETVAQMVTDLRAADKPLIQSGPFIQTRERLRTAADMLTTLAAENAMLRAERDDARKVSDRWAGEAAVLRASEAAALERITALTEYERKVVQMKEDFPNGI